MESKINGLHSHLVLQQEPRLGTRQAAADTPAPAGTGQDRIELTASARSIRETERAQSTASAVDSGRVAAVRQALAEGSLSVSAERIAQGLLSIEKLLSGSR